MRPTTNTRGVSHHGLNELLLGFIADDLEASGLRVLTSRTVPGNDGGVALGQVALASITEPGGENPDGACPG